MAGSFFHEMRQNANIGQAKADAREAQRSAEGAGEAIKRLERKVESLTLITQALFTFLQSSQGLSEADLMARVQEIASNGRTAAVACSECGRMVGKAQSKCMYCGTEKKLNSIFDTL